ncbi:DNA-binding NarL/FixJ family response regulator [Nocardioides daedukensis]|uniref:DNA-binding NarL/FixJ family response regulator n=1 Tax=Nocardioides daedukensis TaxID=634462 RepID=A0A7Y9S0W4_9ACTN|nr:DNA-binding NarL/FixJ family response regulator [Nocardioides daedukensis]
MIVEDHTLFSESLKISLQIEGHHVCSANVDQAGRNVRTLLPVVMRHEPRVVLLDLDLGVHGNGMHLIQPLAQAGVSVVVITGSVKRSRWGEAIALGARVVMSKNSSLNEIAATIRRINEGMPVLSRESRAELLAEWRQEQHAVKEAQRRLELLTRREAEVLWQFMAGRQVREIAAISVVSESTVRTQVKSLLAKLGVSSQLAAVGMAQAAHWHPPGG